MEQPDFICNWDGFHVVRLAKHWHRNVDWVRKKIITLLLNKHFVKKIVQYFVKNARSQTTKTSFLCLCFVFDETPKCWHLYNEKQKQAVWATVNTRRCQLVCQKSQHKHCQDNSQLTVCLPTVKSTSQHLLVRHLL